jgi:hypothetical protein
MEGRGEVHFALGLGFLLLLLGFDFAGHLVLFSVRNGQRGVFVGFLGRESVAYSLASRWPIGVSRCRGIMF